ncbi:MAG: hypothetical protein GY951_02470 [Psychromonas sp.]|nr:hypothetical protein [Psychromonas sp.]
MIGLHTYTVIEDSSKNYEVQDINGNMLNCFTWEDEAFDYVEGKVDEGDTVDFLDQIFTCNEWTELNPQ